MTIQTDYKANIRRPAAEAYLTLSRRHITGDNRNTPTDGKDASSVVEPMDLRKELTETRLKYIAGGFCRKKSLTRSLSNNKILRCW